MCNECDDNTQKEDPARRRDVLKAAAALFTVPLVAGASAGAQAAAGNASVGTGPFRTRAYGTKSATSPLEPMSITRRPIGPRDVLIDVLADREQNCVNGATFTYNSPEAASGGHTFGGYADKIVVKERFSSRVQTRIPESSVRTPTGLPVSPKNFSLFLAQVTWICTTG